MKPGYRLPFDVYCVFQSSSDVALLVNARNLAHRLLNSLLPPSSPSSTPLTTTHTYPSVQTNNSKFRIGFIVPPFKDSKIPVSDHLHAHAYIEPGDLMGWWRGVAYSGLAFYSIDDLIAEIRYIRAPYCSVLLPLIPISYRESVSNNRVKSGYQNRGRAPIDMVPSAGARSGTADGIETSEPSIAVDETDLESGDSRPTTPLPRRSDTLSPTSQIPPLRV